MYRNRHLALLPLLGLSATLLGVLLPREAAASSADEFLTLTGSVDANIIFLLDLSGDMNMPCALEGTPEVELETGLGPDTAPGPDTAAAPSPAPPGPGDTGGGGSYDAPCIVLALDAINQVAMHFDGLRYSVVGTVDDSTDTSFYPIVPLGSSPAEVSAAISGLDPFDSPTRNLSEALSILAEDYISVTDADNGEDDDGDGYTGDWAEAPIQYACQETHVITITVDRPSNDIDTSSPYTSSVSDDVICDNTGSSASDLECLYDNTVYEMYNTDYRADLSGDQNVTVHTLLLGGTDGSIADLLYTNASELTGGEGMYTNVSDSDEILGSIMTIIRDIRSGTYSRSTPVISADGSYLIYAFYEIDGDEPLAEGHVRGYEIEDDPTSANYGQVLYDGPTEYGGALWDAGDLLVSRPITSSESNPDDRDGFGKRDIYTFFEEAQTVMSSEADSDHRMGFDYEFVAALATDSSVLDLVMNTSADMNPPCADDQSYDLNDDCLVDEDDLQSMVDFARGLPEATFRFLDLERGIWKLGDSPHSVPVVVQKRNGAYTVDPTYRIFLREMAKSDYPDIVLIAANDGMLHAFGLKDESYTLDDEAGEELWAWIPGQLLYRSQDPAWSGRLIDLLLYGRTFLFDGTPVVEDVWIDADDDNTKDCTSLSDCEWRRIVVVQQGKGGVDTLALDITDPTSPEFLWEQTDETDTGAMGYTVSTPVIANVYDKSSSDSDDWQDRWVAMWGSGRAVPWGLGDSNYEDAEANLYMWHTGDDFWGTSSVGYSDHGDNGHPEEDVYSSTLDADGDGHYEYGYISGALAVVDVDSDGDADTIYFPVTTSYSPEDEGGSGPGDIQDPGATWMYKACIDTSAPDDMTWIEFYDPVDDSSGVVTKRPEVYYSATTAWMSDGTLGVYWGTGSPYSRDTTSTGYFFAVLDSDPISCDSDTMTPVSDCGADGVIELDAGESLVGTPVVYAGVVYFTTWAPGEDVCDGGEGRLYALDYTDCDAVVDLNGDDEVTDADLYTTIDGYPSAVTVSDYGTVMVGTATPDTTSDTINVIKTSDSLLYVSQTLAWMEKF